MSARLETLILASVAYSNSCELLLNTGRSYLRNRDYRITLSSWQRDDIWWRLEGQQGAETVLAWTPFTTWLSFRFCCSGEPVRNGKKRRGSEVWRSNATPSLTSQRDQITSNRAIRRDSSSAPSTRGDAEYWILKQKYKSAALQLWDLWMNGTEARNNIII